MSISAAIGTRSRENSRLKNGIKSRADHLISAKQLNFDNFQLSMNTPPPPLNHAGLGRDVTLNFSPNLYLSLFLSKEADV
jgi:hypothetical protein